MTDISLSLGFLLLVFNLCHFSRILASQSLDENGNIIRAWENMKDSVKISNKSPEAAYTEWVDERMLKIVRSKKSEYITESKRAQCRKYEKQKTWKCEILKEYFKRKINEFGRKR